MSTALVISGGGSKGAFAVGAIEVLHERGVHFDFIVGTSTGALIGPLVAIDDIDELVRIYTSVKTKHIIRKNWRRLFYNALYDTKPLEKLIRKTMCGSRFDKLQTATSIHLCAVNLFTSDLRYFSQKSNERPENLAWRDFEEFVHCVLASTNQPVLMPPSIVQGQPYVDGGVREIAPISYAQQLGATQIYAVINSPEHNEIEAFLPRIDHIGIRALDLMTTEILNSDVAQAKCFDLIVIRPDSSLTDNDLEFVPSKMQTMRKAGQQKAKEVLL